MKVCGEKEDVAGAVMPKLDEADLQAICDILGATDRGLTGPKIGRHLKECDFPDPAPDYKRHRLYAALLEKQNTDRCANYVLGGVSNFGS
jgi:hypothetical protein